MISGTVAACMMAAAVTYHLPPSLLVVIAEVEGGRAGLVSPNTNGSYDMGLMQINSLFLQRLSAHYKVDPDVVRRRLVEDDCYNVTIAAWLLSRSIQEADGFWTGVAHYHSHTPDHADRYLRKVVATTRRLYGTALERNAEHPQGPEAK